MVEKLFDSPIFDGLLARIEAKRDELMDLTRALIRFPTVNPPGEAYAACAEAIGTRLARRGFAVEYLRAEGTPGDCAKHPRINVVARLEGWRPGPTIHFNGHIDVVEAGRGWTVEPFAAVVKDGRIYGRGACDMKGGLAAAIIAAEAIAEHGSMPFLVVSAIRNMATFLGRLERDLYPKLDSRPTAMPVIPSEARRSTLNINSIHGGQPAETGDDLVPSPLVADSCRLIIDRRFLIEEKAAGVKAEVVDLLEALKREWAGFDYRLRDIMTVDPLMTDADSPLVKSLDAGIAQILGQPARHVVSPGTYDQKHVARIGHLKDCVAYGPGILELAHQPNEFIEIEDMLQSSKVMALATVSLQGGVS